MSHAQHPEDERQRFMRTKVLPYYTAMARLLALMVGDAGRERWKRDGPWLCQCAFLHEDFELRVVCRDKRIRPFLAYMERPCRHSAYLGRLKPDGTVHVFDHGLKAFFDQLMSEGVLEQFTAALHETVTHYEALDRSAGDGRRDESRPTTPQNATAPDITH